MDPEAETFPRVKKSTNHIEIALKVSDLAGRRWWRAPNPSTQEARQVDLFSLVYRVSPKVAMTA